MPVISASPRPLSWTGQEALAISAAGPSISVFASPSALSWTGGRVWWRPRQRFGAQRVRFMFERFIVVEWIAPLSCACRFDAPLLLLDDVPGLVRQMLLLAGPEMDVAALRESERAELRRLGRIAVDADVVHREPDSALDARLQRRGKAGGRLRLRRGRRPADCAALSWIACHIGLRCGPARRGAGAAAWREATFFAGGAATGQAYCGTALLLHVEQSL